MGCGCCAPRLLSPVDSGSAVFGLSVCLSFSFYFRILAFFSRYSRVIKCSKFVVYVCVCVVAFLHDCLMCQVRHCFIYQCDIVHLFLPLSFSSSHSLLIYVNLILILFVVTFSIYFLFPIFFLFASFFFFYFFFFYIFTSLSYSIVRVRLIEFALVLRSCCFALLIRVCECVCDVCCCCCCLFCQKRARAKHERTAR